MVEVVRGALLDAEVPSLAARLELIVAVRGSWSYRDPARLVAERLDAVGSRTAITSQGGNSPVTAFNTICRRIASGDLQCAVLMGGEAVYARRKLREVGLKPARTQQPDVAPDEQFGPDFAMSTPVEEAVGFGSPVGYYALFENALRASRSMTITQQKESLGAFWAPYSQIASTNPYAWTRDRLSAEEISHVSETNPYIAFPYTKRMCSNWFTDQAAAVVVCSSGAADALGVPADQRVHVWAGSDATDTLEVGARASLSSSPALRVAGTELFDRVGIGPEAMDFIDVYSCFASAVQVATDELGITKHDPPTLTGGMPYFGGPLNNFATHSLVQMVTALRSAPSLYGLVTANGGFLTKHALTMLSVEPTPAPYRSTVLPARPDDVRVENSLGGEVEVESNTVLFDGGQPRRLVLACRTMRGSRGWAMSDDLELLEESMESELAGRIVTVREGVATL
jgi:acetyl-CoA C-acetyltransferase